MERTLQGWVPKPEHLRQAIDRHDKTESLIRFNMMMESGKYLRTSEFWHLGSVVHVRRGDLVEADHCTTNARELPNWQDSMEIEYLQELVLHYVRRPYNEKKIRPLLKQLGQHDTEPMFDGWKLMIEGILETWHAETSLRGAAADQRDAAIELFSKAHQLWKSSTSVPQEWLNLNRYYWFVSLTKQRVSLADHASFAEYSQRMTSLFSLIWSEDRNFKRRTRVLLAKPFLVFARPQDDA